MSASKSTYLRGIVYNAVLKATAFTGPATMYMSLHTAAPGLTGANEVTGNAYARTAIAFGAPAGGSGSNSGAVTFPAPTPAAWGTVTHFGIWDAATLGNLLYEDALTAVVATSINVPLTFPAGTVSVAET
jgi:hypothetical protein